MCTRVGFPSPYSFFQADRKLFQSDRSDKIVTMNRSGIAEWGLFLLGSMAILAGCALAEDLPYVFDDSSMDLENTAFTPAQLKETFASSIDLAGVPFLSKPNEGDILEFPVTGGGNASGEIVTKKVDDLKEIFDSRVEPENPRVRTEAVALVAQYPGDYTIDQISLIYTTLKEGWRYVRDPRGVDYYMYANETLAVGEKARCVGAGDCDDFAILMAALVESVGGTTRVILAHNNSTGGHAFTEVYIGKPGDSNSHVKEVISWLREKFNADKIFTHVDTDTEDVWLNLDWGVDERGSAHPGGPFYQGDRHIVLCIRDRYGSTPVNPPENSLTTASYAQPKPVQNVYPPSGPAVTSASPVNPITISPGETILPGAGPVDWYTTKS